MSYGDVGGLALSDSGALLPKVLRALRHTVDWRKIRGQLRVSARPPARNFTNRLKPRSLWAAGDSLGRPMDADTEAALGKPVGVGSLVGSVWAQLRFLGKRARACSAGRCGDGGSP